MNLEFGASLSLVFLISAACVLVSTPFVMRKLARAGLVSQDKNKAGKPLLPKMGGIAIIFGFAISTLVSLQLSSQLIEVPLMLASITSVLLISLLGLGDDLIGIRDLWRVILPAFAALPLMVTKAGNSFMTLPLLGRVNFDLGVVSLPLLGAIDANLYVLLLIPVGVVACSNLINLLAGFNGLEVGCGAVVCASLLAALLLSPQNAGTVTAAFLLAGMLGACLAFLKFNWSPAKVFPGNSTTYAIGAVVVAAVVVGNFERVGAIALGPQIIEFLLKARSRFQAENFGKAKGGRLYYEGKTFSLTHAVMKAFKPTETRLVLMLLAFQALFGLLAIASVFF